MSILKIINELAATPSRKAKEEILNREFDNKLLQQVFKAAYDPTVNYFIKKIPEYVCSQRANLAWAIGSTGIQLLSSRQVTGHAAVSHLKDVLEHCDADDARVIELIIKRDLRCGVTASTANKIWKGLIPEFSYMRCSLPAAVKLDQWDWKNGIYSQQKMDAMFANVMVYEDSVVITSRNGTEFPQDNIQEFVTDCTTLQADRCYHGELMVYEDGNALPREISNGIMNSIAKGGKLENPNHVIKYFVWDAVPIENFMKGETYKVPYDVRFKEIKSYVDGKHINLVPFKIVYSYEEALEHYFEMLDQGYEGTVIKTKSGIWEDKTSKNQVKMKLEVEVELRAVELNPGNGKNVNTFGSIKCVSECGQLEVNVPGFSDDERARIYHNWDLIRDSIMTVKANGLMKPTGKKQTWSLFLPGHVEWRLDKDVADDLIRIKDIFESTIKGK